ncbi:hypothetical protein Glove_585g40 [Diversispora epigaea]|uniref:Uncharacterized protein n=1 Tax=Diversispora epigaea TaxID=1348612 RepID=A0A397GH38_9GLOM|nr:hypothetical protein Glove_585g40 [Diversispora epigaea]
MSFTSRKYTILKNNIKFHSENWPIYEESTNLVNKNIELGSFSGKHVRRQRNIMTNKNIELRSISGKHVRRQRNIKTKFSALFLIFLVFSHASPLPRAVGDKATVTLTKLDGLVTFTQVDESNIKVEGKLNKGIEENTPDNYFIILFAIESFSQLGINIVVPGTDKWEGTDPGYLSLIIGLDFSIFHGDEVLDSASITKG